MDKEDVDKEHVYSGMLLSHRKTEITPSAATRMDLETVTLVTKVRQKKTNIIHHSYTEFIYERETDSQRTDLWLPRGTEKGRDEMGVWDKQIETILHTE